MASRQPSLAARALQPLAASLWTLFLVWTAIVAAVWLGEIGDTDLQEHIANPGLRGALELILRSLDAAWFVIAGANAYLVLAEVEGIAVARRWGALVMGGAWLISAASAWTAVPLGAIHYTARLGMRIGPVPFGLLLLWLAFVLGARALVLRLAPRASHFQVSIAVGFVVALTAANLDPLAWKFRAFWIWRTMPVPVWWNLASWLVASFAFAFFMRETRVASSAWGGFPRPATALIIFNVIFLLVHAARFFRS